MNQTRIARHGKQATLLAVDFIDQPSLLDGISSSSSKMSKQLLNARAHVGA